MRGELPLSAPIYELDGTSAGSRNPVTRPGQASALRPLVGAAVLGGRDGGPLTGAAGVPAGLVGDRGPSARRARQRHQRREAVGDRERRWRNRAYVAGGARLQPPAGRVRRPAAAGQAAFGFARQWLTLEYSYLAPTFDGDSIWNVFASGAYRDLRAVYELGIGPEVKAYARGFARFFTAVRPSRAAPAWGRPGGAGAGWCAPTATSMTATGAASWVSTRRRAWRSNARFELEGRLTGYQWRADLATGAGTTNDGGVVFGAQAGGRWLLGQGVRLHLLAEDNVGTYYRSQFRGLAVVEVDASAMMTRRRRFSARLPPCFWRSPPGPRWAPARNAPSPLIYPAETIPLAFDHAQHARLGATCESCHSAAQTSTSAADNLIPREAACRACHKIDRAQPTKAVPQGQGAARCDACHVGWTGIG